MIRCDRCGAVLAVRVTERLAEPNAAHTALMVCPNLACENGRSGRVLQRVLLSRQQPGENQEE